MVSGRKQHSILSRVPFRGLRTSGQGCLFTEHLHVGFYGLTADIWKACRSPQVAPRSLRRRVKLKRMSELVRALHAPRTAIFAAPLSPQPFLRAETQHEAGPCIKVATKADAGLQGGILCKSVRGQGVER